MSFDNFGGGGKGSEGVHTLGQKFVLFLDDLNEGSVLESNSQWLNDRVL